MAPYLSNGRISNDAARVDQGSGFGYDRSVSFFFIDIDSDAAVFSGRHATTVATTQRDRNDGIDITQQNGHTDAYG